MNRLFLLVCVFLINAPLFAQQTCPVPDKTVVIFFGNGINTTNRSAQESLKTLQDELGDTYNGQTLRYDLAYNRTTNIGVDLAQSVAQAGAQFSSQIMGWFNNIGVAPNRFKQQDQNFAFLGVDSCGAKTI